MQIQKTNIFSSNIVQHSDRKYSNYINKQLDCNKSDSVSFKSANVSDELTGLFDNAIKLLKQRLGSPLMAEVAGWKIQVAIPISPYMSRNWDCVIQASMGNAVGRYYYSSEGIIGQQFTNKGKTRFSESAFFSEDENRYYQKAISRYLRAALNANPGETSEI